MSRQLGRLAELLPLLTARLHASAADGRAVSTENRDAIAQLMLLRADIALRLKHAAIPPVELLHLDAALAELEAAFRAASTVSDRAVSRAVETVIAPTYNASSPVLGP